MKALPTFLLATVSLLAGIALVKCDGLLSNMNKKELTDLPSPLDEEIMVMRTRGGLLEVSSIRATEIFERKIVTTILWTAVGETVLSIRVPAVYRYQVELAPEWRISRNGNLFTVIAPPVKPSLPVAVDFARLEKNESGLWSLLPGTGNMDEFQRSISARLKKKATLPVYIELQRASARKTVEEFVRKWLVTQTQWKSASQPDIKVLFADEPIESLGPDVFPLYQAPARQAATN